MSAGPKPITMRSYKMLQKKLETLRNAARTNIGDAKLKALEEKLAAYSVPCRGEAHSNGYIDNCGLCLHFGWGVVPNRELVKAEDKPSLARNVDYIDRFGDEG